MWCSPRTNSVGEVHRIHNLTRQPEKNLRYASKLEPNVSIFDKFTLDRKQRNRVDFDPSHYDHLFATTDDSVSKQGLSVKQALVIPHQTIMSCFDRDPKQPDLGKRNSTQQGLKDMAFLDSRGQYRFRVDKTHGLRNGGTICQTTHGRLNTQPGLRFRTNSITSERENKKNLQKRISLVK